MFYESLLWTLPMDKSSTIEKFFWFWEYKMIFINVKWLYKKEL
jgi:hypothetical protein